MSAWMTAEWYMHSILISIWYEYLNPEKMDRKEFINRFVRGGLLALLAVVPAILVSRKQVSLEESCSEDFMCRNCQRLERCELPEAITERKNG